MMSEAVIHGPKKDLEELYKAIQEQEIQEIDLKEAFNYIEKLIPYAVKQFFFAMDGMIIVQGGVVTDYLRWIIGKKKDPKPIANDIDFMTLSPKEKLKSMSPQQGILYERYPKKIDNRLYCYQIDREIFEIFSIYQENKTIVNMFIDSARSKHITQRSIVFIIPQGKDFLYPCDFFNGYSDIKEQIVRSISIQSFNSNVLSSVYREYDAIFRIFYELAQYPNSRLDPELEGKIKFYSDYAENYHINFRSIQNLLIKSFKTNCARKFIEIMMKYNYTKTVFIEPETLQKKMLDAIDEVQDEINNGTNIELKTIYEKLFFYIFEEKIRQFDKANINTRVMEHIFDTMSQYSAVTLKENEKTDIRDSWISRIVNQPEVVLSYAEIVRKNLPNFTREVSSNYYKNSNHSIPSHDSYLIPDIDKLFFKMQAFFVDTKNTHKLELAEEKENIDSSEGTTNEILFENNGLDINELEETTIQPVPCQTFAMDFCQKKREHKMHGKDSKEDKKENKYIGKKKYVKNYGKKEILLEELTKNPSPNFWNRVSSYSQKVFSYYFPSKKIDEKARRIANEKKKGRVFLRMKREITIATTQQRDAFAYTSSPTTTTFWQKRSISSCLAYLPWGVYFLAFCLTIHSLSKFSFLWDDKLETKFDLKVNGPFIFAVFSTFLAVVTQQVIQHNMPRPR